MSVYCNNTDREKHIRIISVSIFFKENNVGVGSGSGGIGLFVENDMSHPYNECNRVMHVKFSKLHCTY